jgi:mRNA-degrading endonuclease toxin of MazEF toxin-antitoxin module
MIKSKISILVSKIENIKNDITIPLISWFLDWFIETIELHFIKKSPNLIFKKWDIYFVNLWKNIWSELNKTRPCIVYSIKKANFWDTIIIIPIKSLKWKKIKNDFNIIITPSKENNLQKNSFCDISWLKQISKKRILNKIWNLEKLYLTEIDTKTSNIFWIKK